MASPMASTCETYRHSEQKWNQKFCRSKEGKNSETHPEKPKKGKTGCVLGAGGDGNGWEWVKPDGKTRKARRKSRDGLVSAAASVGAGRSPQATSAPRHAPQAGLRAHLVAKSYRTLTKKSGTAEAIPDFFGRGRRTWSPLRSGRLVACVPPARTRPSARGFGVDVGEHTGGTGEGQCCPVSNASPGEDGAGLVLWEIFRAKTGEKEREIPEKT